MDLNSLLLDRLSNELIHHILVLLDPFSLFNVLSSCRTLRDFVKGNKLLHKEIYLRIYDDPSRNGEPDWEEEMHANAKLELILESSDRDIKGLNLAFVAERIRRLLETAALSPASSLNLALLNDYFDEDEETGRDNRDVFLCSSSLFDQGGTKMQTAAPTSEMRQLSAKLHCLWGQPIDPVPYTRLSSRFGSIRLPRDLLIGREDTPAMNTRLRSPEDIPVHMVARGKVYNLSEYTLQSLWGPFMADGSHRTDWEKIEAIMVVLGFNLSRFTERSDGRFPYVWSEPWVGAAPHSFISPPAPADHGDPALDQIIDDIAEEPRMLKQLDPSLESQDPYGVTGSWMRVVCFLDYNDLYNYNFNADDETPEGSESRIIRHGRRSSGPIDTEEAIRLIRIKLRVTKIEPPSDEEEEDWDEKPDPDFSGFKGERLPIVHFIGDSRSLHASWDPNANSKIRGSVRQTPEGEIRWTTFSIFHGEERWRSEGIQVGGLKSARGVLGNWFDKDFDLHGPAGPTAFWKESDHLHDLRRSDGSPVAYF